MQGPVGHCEDFGGRYGSVLNRGGTWGAEAGIGGENRGRDYREGGTAVIQVRESWVAAR